MQQFLKENLSKINPKNPLFLVIVVLAVLFLLFYFLSFSEGEKNQNVAKETNTNSGFDQKLKVISGEQKKNDNQKLLVVKDQKENSSGDIKVLTNQEANGPSGGQIQDQLQLGAPELQGRNIPDLQQIEKPANVRD